MEKMKGRITVSLLVVLTSVGLAGLEGQAFAQESSDTGGGLGSSKLIGAGMAFGLADPWSRHWSWVRRCGRSRRN